ncbi:MAG: polyprenyl synthetase family protein [Patescibacteria group bacterium]
MKLKSNAFVEATKATKALVWPEIKKYLKQTSQFPQYCQVPGKYQNMVQLHQEMVDNYPVRMGKYVRPTLVLLSAQAMGLSPQKAVKTAAAMEMSENWILCHDDIEDDSLQRRGLPAIHRVYNKELAINAGDGMHNLMWKIVSDINNPAISEEFYQLQNRTVLGQTIEIKWTQDNRVDLKEEDILLILESKTAYYTIAGPMRLGAILAGANKKQLDLIYQLGKPLGYCFQIRDDLLDLTSDFSGLKQQVGNDIYEGKRTIMLIHLLGHIKGKDKTKLLSILEKDRYHKTATEVVWVIKTMDKCGSLEYSRQLIEKYANQARILLETKLQFLDHQPARDQLFAFIEFLKTRKH